MSWAERSTGLADHHPVLCAHFGRIDSIHADIALIDEQIDAPQATLTGEPNAPWTCTKAAPFTCTHPGPVPANGKLFIMNRNQLYALQEGAQLKK